MQKVRYVAERMTDIGIQKIALGETIGIAVPKDIRKLFDTLDGVLSPEKTVMHLHDTRGTALACAWEAMQCGVVWFGA